MALVSELDPDSEYVRVRFDAEAHGKAVEPIHQAYRAHYLAAPIATWAQGQCNFAAALPRRTGCCRLHTWG